jgi:hypothetical protein
VIDRIKDAASITILWTGIAGFCGGLGYVTWQHLTGLLASPKDVEGRERDRRLLGRSTDAP